MRASTSCSSLSARRGVLRGVQLLVLATSLAGSTAAAQAPHAAPAVHRADDPNENAFTAAALSITDDAIVLSLTARSAIQAPRLRTEEGFVRIWFPAMPGWTQLDRAGDGNAIRFVRIRPGAEDAGVVIVRLGDLRLVPERAIAVVVDGTHAEVRFRRDALAPIVQATATPAAQVAAAAATLPVTRPTEVPEIEEVVVPAASAASAPSATEPAMDDEALLRDAPLDPEPLTGRRTPDGESALGTLPAGESSTRLYLLGLVTVGLLGVLGFLKLRQQKNGGQAKPLIRVIATHRLGAKQELVVVRALGQDHFLSVDAQRTERLLSLPAEDDGREAVPHDDSTPLLQLVLGGRREAANETPDGNAFGAELLKLAADRSRTDRNLVQSRNVSSPPEGEPKEGSDAVAGLMRLKRNTQR